MSHLVAVVRSSLRRISSSDLQLVGVPGLQISVCLIDVSYKAVTIIPLSGYRVLSIQCFSSRMF